jgi:Flp pilus assembly CpaE family ATPase
MVANPDVPSIRNSQRLLDRIGQLGACGDRVRILMNRSAEPYPIPPAQIEQALGHPIYHTFPSDYKTVSTALNSGVPLALSAGTEMAAQFGKFTRRLLQPEAADTSESSGKRGAIGLQRLASIW